MKEIYPLCYNKYGDNMKVVNNINDFIFRGYDIRGIVEKDIDENVSYTIGKAFGSKIKEEDKKNTIIGYDNRESSPIISKALIKGIIDTGINVIDIGLVTTPMYYYALNMLKITSGIMITGSHNPINYNGLKITFNGIHNAYGQTIKDFRDFIKQQQFINGQGEIKKEDIKKQYIDYITSSIQLGNRKLKVVIDCGNATASIIVKDVLNRFNLEYIPLYCNSDPTFPNHHPDPSVEKNMADLKAKVIETNADIGLAFDGDADRIGIIDEQGNMINADHFMIIIIRNIINNLDDKRILYDVKCSKALEDEIKKLGGTPICYRTGNSCLRFKIAKDNIKFGGELAGHIFFNDKFYGYDDGIYAGLRMLEILSKTNKKVSELLIGINQYYSTNELKIKALDNIKFEKIKKVINYCDKKGYKTLTIDGCKAIFDDGFALIRASNTGPNITMRFEAKTKERLKEIQEEFENLLNNI